MKHLMTVLALSTALLSPSAFANAHKEAPDMKKAAASAPMTPQQNKMATCNAEAGDKKGDARKDFMKTCLSSKPVSQQDKMRSCNASATGKKGEDRNVFMKECLSN
jgi:hypothetical protein